jgi:hypothetical protein
MDVLEWCLKDVNWKTAMRNINSLIGVTLTQN